MQCARKCERAGDVRTRTQAERKTTKLQRCAVLFVKTPGGKQMLRTQTDNRPSPCNSHKFSPLITTTEQYFSWLWPAQPLPLAPNMSLPTQLIHLLTYCIPEGCSLLSVPLPSSQPASRGARVRPLAHRIPEGCSLQPAPLPFTQLVSHPATLRPPLPCPPICSPIISQRVVACNQRPSLLSSQYYNLPRSALHIPSAHPSYPSGL